MWGGGGGGGGGHDHTVSDSLIQNKFLKSRLSNNDQDIVTAFSPPVAGCLLELQSSRGGRREKGQHGQHGHLRSPLARPLATDLPVI